MIEDAFIKRFPSLWALKYKTIKGKPTTYTSTESPFKHRPWQQAILDDNHPNKVVEKSTCFAMYVFFLNKNYKKQE